MHIVVVALHREQAAARLQIPHPDRPVVGAARQPLPRQGGQGIHVAGVPQERRHAAPTVAPRPDADALVVGAARQSAARQGDESLHGVGVSHERRDAIASLRVPHLDAMVPAATRQPVALQIHEGPDSIGVPLQRSKAATGLDVPQLYHFVVGAAGQHVGAEGNQGVHVTIVAPQRGQALPTLHVPDLDRIVQRGTGQPTVPHRCKCMHSAAVSREHPLPPRGQGPDRQPLLLRHGVYRHDLRRQVPPLGRHAHTAAPGLARYGRILVELLLAGALVLRKLHQLLHHTLHAHHEVAGWPIQHRRQLGGQSEELRAQGLTSGPFVADGVL
mmetsp:Transcript_113369/g.305913  ORF Transcript_113369/g.305913 Transcript_113369/m.305913 type:complete len:329 (-) Transcript_113369:70-1056(-)